MTKNRGVSNAVLSIPDSVTHGTAARLVADNRGRAEDDQIIDLSIGALDTPTDPRIDQGVIEFITKRSDMVHAFAPVRGFLFLRESVAARVARIHRVRYDPQDEILVTPGGVKGSISATFHALLDPGDEVVIPVPNWPHYIDMVRLHEAVPVTVMVSTEEGLAAGALQEALSPSTKIVVLGDCINPTGKVYSTEELVALAEVIAAHNVRREAAGESPVHVLFDCPYEAHVPGGRARSFPALEVALPDGGLCSMRPYTMLVTGPGKTYGMHGDRIGYLCGPADLVDAAARAQVNLTSFASTYGQVATHVALQPELDAVATERARTARANLETMLAALAEVPGLQVRRPQGGYFLFVDLAPYAEGYAKLGHDHADQFLLAEARVATISGSHFVGPGGQLNDVVRINCGRTASLLGRAGERIREALRRVGADGPPP